MKTHILTAAAALSDYDLLARLDLLAATEREATVELLAHLAALDSRPALFSAQGYGSLFAYCTQALRLSEDAACNRIEAARACRRFPAILDSLARGSLSLTSVRLLARQLTPENHQAVLARASGRSRREIEALIAELAPQPDVPTSVRRLPNPTRMRTLEDPKPTSHSAPALPQPEAAPTPPGPVSAHLPASTQPVPAALVPPPRPVVQASAPGRYRVQFTIGEQTHEKLRRLQAQLRREIPDGDPAAIVDRALSVLLEKVERAKLGVATKPAERPYPAIRPGADSSASRHLPRQVKRDVWRRDDGRCAFVSATGVRCTERTFLEWHHKKPYALQGPATLDNIALRCRRHNQYEAQLVFGPPRASSAAFLVDRMSPPDAVDITSGTEH